MKETTESYRSCLNCRFWDPETETSNWGRCRRYPPQFWIQGEESGSCFASTNGNDWCGEHQTKKNLHKKSLKKINLLKTIH